MSRFGRLPGTELCFHRQKHDVTEALNSVPGVSFGGIKPYGTFTHHLLPYYDEFESTSFVLLSRQGGDPSQIRFAAGMGIWC